MWMERNYKDCVRISLYVMKELRNKICTDSEKHYSVIYNGLHESESENVRNLYFQAYEMEWLDSHWDVLTDLLKQYRKQCGKGQEQEVTVFFAEYFSSILSEIDTHSGIKKAAMREIITAQKEAIEQMIKYADHWEEHRNQLKVNLKKHKEYYRRLIERFSETNTDKRKELD